jgi:catechol 2,3-dioxygenase-like lactoylglutathione lyase family enzyme
MDSDRPAPRSSRIGVKVYVEDLPRVRDFYKQGLGLDIHKQSPEVVNFAGTFSLIALPARGEGADITKNYTRQGNALVYVETQDPTRAFESVIKCNAKIVTALRNVANKPCFRCLDPAGNMVEVYRTQSNKIPGASVDENS